VAGRYLVEGVIGRGAMGIVLGAKDQQTGKSVAVKVMLPAAARSEDAVARFMREARSASQLESEHVVRVSEVGKLHGEQPYMVMERLHGSDLRAELDQRGRLPLEEAADYLLQALEALAKAHAAGIVHRDLKPGNLFLTQAPDGSRVVKVLDFGISKVITGVRAPSDPLTHAQALLGSPLYMSPEQMKSAKNLDGRSDLWSMGVILYEFLTGEVPFQGDSLPEVCAQIVLDGETPRARDHVPELPAAIDGVIARCLARKLAERYATAAELAEALAPFASKEARRSVERIAKTLAPGRAEASTTASRRRERTIPAFNGKLAAAALGVALVALGLALLLLR
jgi:eukaryotic-like serine/threonine-protein kinase